MCIHKKQFAVVTSHAQLSKFKEPEKEHFPTWLRMLNICPVHPH